MSEELAFRKEDCAVQSATVDDTHGGQRSPRWGTYQGNVVDGQMGPSVKNQINAVTVTHIPTGISVTVDRFHPHRNKELAMLEVEKLVNELIKEIKAQNGQV